MRKFTPRKNQIYWMINSRWEVKETWHTGSLRSRGRVEAGNAFRTRQDAELFKEHMLSTAKRLTRPWWRFW